MKSPSSPSLSADALLQRYNQGERDFSGYNLAHINLAIVDLSYINLQDCCLNQAILNGTDLIQSCLVRANLSRAKLLGANLTGANLSEANLEDAIFSSAQMVSANLVRAKLRGAILSGANLRGANLRGADLRETNFSGADLSGADLLGAQARGSNLEDGFLNNTILPDGTVASAVEEEDLVSDIDDEDMTTILLPKDVKPAQSDRPDDGALLHYFVSHEVPAMTGQTLSFETLENLCILRNQQGQTLAQIALGDLPVASIVPETDIATALHQVLISYNYMPLLGSEPPTYIQKELPPEYLRQDSNPLQLWRVWWNCYRHRDRAPIPLLILYGREWCAVQEAQLQGQRLSLTTAQGAVQLEVAQPLLWLYPQELAPWIEANLMAVDLGTLQEVVHYQGDRLIIQTRLGTLTLEGQNLRCFLAEMELSTAELGA